MKKCCCTGHRPKGFPWKYADKSNKKHQAYLLRLRDRIEELVVNESFDYFISGGALGSDMDFAETVLALKQKYKHIRLEIAVPCENQDLKWSIEDKQRYKSIIAQADVVNVLSRSYTRFCMLKRNEYMVNSSEKIIAIWNGAEEGGTYYTINYAHKKNKKIEYILL